MITNSELNIVELSPTKKDFYQIWNELLELAGKISERWDPTSTNESDPGIVLLKVLTAIADKINYTIDVNTLEAFMPSAAQEDSMRKLTEMLGYSMKYYQSAVTDVKISYNINNTDSITTPVIINKFTNIKDIDNTINYITLKDAYLNINTTSVVIPCMEGELVECETDDHNIVSMFHLDDNKRYYLPETQIAENGIFITNITDGFEEEAWEKVDNLNTQPTGAHVFKFGFDSREGLPYVQFPMDISSIIEDGLKIKYLRTNGVNGNVSPKTLCKMETPSIWAQFGESDADYFKVENYNVTNASAASNGRNKESLNDAYNNYKKTIGTFDTLVTCRDYINKIYQMTVSDSSNTPLVSNVIVSDIRDDINKAMTIGTFTQRGIEYKTMAKPINVVEAESISRTAYTELIASATNLGKLYKVYEDSSRDKILFYARCIFNGSSYEFIIISVDELTHFDLVIYPFKTVYGLNTKAEYIKSFKYDESTLLEIQDNLEENKTLAHNFVAPNKDDVACIKNYYRLTAKITTTKKVNTIEQADILGKVYSKLYENFNMRNVEFGEELPYESILKVLETADPRIKSVNLEDPDIVTKYCLVNGEELEADIILSENPSVEDKNKYNLGNSYYNKLALNNVLAGRVELFNYDLDFKPDYTESQYPDWVENDKLNHYDLIYPNENSNPEGYRETDIVFDSNNTIIQKTGIHRMEANFEIADSTPTFINKDLKLKENEVVQFRLPNLKTVTTYPAYVNYYAHLNSASDTAVPALPATMQTLLQFIERGAVLEVSDNESEWTKAKAWTELITSNNFPASLLHSFTITINKPVISEGETEEDALNRAIYEAVETFNKRKEEYHAVFTKTQIGENNYKYDYVASVTTDYYKEVYSETVKDNVTSVTFTYYYPRFRKDAPVDLSLWRTWLLSLDNYFYDHEDTSVGTNGEVVAGTTIGTEVYKKTHKIKGLYKYNGTDFSVNYGHLVDNVHNKYKLVEVYTQILDDPFEFYYLPRLWYTTTNTSTQDDSASNKHTANGLGQSGQTGGIEKDTDYELKDNEYLLINYTSSSTSDGVDTKTKINEYYGPGTIIKPNFLLTDSETYNLNYRYAKKDGYNFNEFNIQNPEGMFSLGSDEQIEIRDFVSVKLNEVSTNIYWELQEETPDRYNRIKLEFNEDPVDVDGNSVAASDTAAIYKYLSYTLKDGEYFYYTGPNKTDIAWYGAGTKIRRTLNTPEIYKYASDNSISAEDITSQGLSTAIQWRAFDFSDTGKYDKSLSIIEYQYINLVAGDVLCTVTPLNQETSNCIDVAKPITRVPQQIKTASYALGVGEGTVNSTNIVSLPKLEMSSKHKNWVCWEVSSRLEFNVGPVTTQTIYCRDGAHSYINLYGISEGTAGVKRDRLIERLQAKKGTPLSFKTNKLYQTSASDISVTTKEFSEDGTLLREIADFKIKVFASSTLTMNTSDGNHGSFLNLNNFGNTFTKLSFVDAGMSKAQRSNQAAVSLNLIVPKERFGLIMLYNTKNSASADSTKIRLIKSNSRTTGTESLTPSIFNYKNNWWSENDLEKTNPYSLGRIVEKIVSVVEEIPFKQLTKDSFEFLLDAGNDVYYKQHIIEELSTDAKGYPIYPDLTEEYNTGLARYDYTSVKENNKTYTITKYIYTKVDSKDDYDETKEFGTLLDIGGKTELYQLRSGINIVKIDSSCTLEIYSDYEGTDSLIISNLDLIYNEQFDPNNSTKELKTPLNPKISYKKLLPDTITGNTHNNYMNDTYTQILNDLAAADPNYIFYYNIPVQNALSIDMNKDDKLDTLDHPSNWYDLNNINNKFVISEIDASYLTTGVTISRNSRSN